MLKENISFVIKCVNNRLKYVGKCNYRLASGRILHQSWGLLLAVDNGECVHIHCVQSVYSEYKYGEATGRLIRPQTRGKRELVFRNY